MEFKHIFVVVISLFLANTAQSSTTTASVNNDASFLPKNSINTLQTLTSDLISTMTSHKNLEFAEQVIHRIELLAAAGKIFDYYSPIPAYLCLTALFSQGCVSTISVLHDTYELWTMETNNADQKKRFLIRQLWNGTHTGTLGYIAFALASSLEAGKLTKAFTESTLNAPLIYTSLGLHTFATFGNMALGFTCCFHKSTKDQLSSLKNTLSSMGNRLAALFTTQDTSQATSDTLLP